MKNTDEVNNKKNEKRIDRRTFLKIAGTTMGALALGGTGLSRVPRAFANLVPQTPLPGSAIPQFVNELPNLHITDSTALELRMQEFQSMVLPANTVPGYTGTWVWGYLEPSQVGQPGNIPSYIGPVILAERGTPTEVTYVNNLGSTATNIEAWDTSTDQTLHWADPLDQGHQMTNYTGPIPTVPHLHGGEVPPVLDGGPDAWYANDGSNQYQGHGYYTHGGVQGGDAPGNYAEYKYPNTQEAANIWFHDHVLGITRLNVYAGLAGAYLIGDTELSLPDGMGMYDLGGETIIPLVIQDRMFDTNGQLYFPAGVPFAPNPSEHPFWVPEFEGDTIVVNGKVWPFKQLEPKRYRFLFLNGSNARTYELFMVDPAGANNFGPSMWVIGTDGGYLDAPVEINPTLGQKLTVMPGERYDVIMDFSAFPGSTLQMRNTGRTPYPKGPTPNGKTLGQIMEFRIGAVPVTDNSYNPDSVTGGGQALRTGSHMIKRLVDPATGTALVIPDVTRQLTLNEVMGAGGPLEVLVNNTKWGGHSSDTVRFTDGIRPDFTSDPSGNSPDTYYSEMPVEGQTELWEIVNITADAHPIHLHLVQFQPMNRQKFNVNKYVKAYDATFPGGALIEAFGPPADYETGKVWSVKDTFGGASVTSFKGGNPDITPYLQGPVKPPLAHEAGWKDTMIMYPGEVTRIMVRWAPTDLPTDAPAADLHFPFDPNGGHGYVWHCHIIDHEDNEMMRPDSVMLNPDAPEPANRLLKKGTDY